MCKSEAGGGKMKKILIFAVIANWPFLVAKDPPPQLPAPTQQQVSEIGSQLFELLGPNGTERTFTLFGQKVIVQREVKLDRT